MTTDEFLASLKKSNLLNPEQWRETRARYVRYTRTAKQTANADEAASAETAIVAGPAPAVEPAGIASWLVERDWVTRWQADMLLAGRTAFFLGKYELLDCIGKGGMGAVFKAEQGGLGRLVAIKLMSRSTVERPGAVERFRQEVQAVAALNDPHIVAAYDAASLGNLHFLVMEYVEGEDLGRRLEREGPLPIDFACECIRQAAEGLQHAHERGMIHRDIKPGNLLVSRDPETGRPLVKVLDLGLARLVVEDDFPAIETEVDPGSVDSRLTRMDQILGTPDYMSPEQATDIRLVDIRSDIFSLGCTLFRLLTGQFAFAGESVVEKLESRVRGTAASLRALRPDVPAALEAVLARMLARDPAERYQQPRDAARALAPFCRDGSPANRPASKTPGDGARLVEPERKSRSIGEETRLEELFKQLGTRGVEIAAVPRSPSRTKVPVRIALIATAGALVFVIAGLVLWTQLTATAHLVVDWPPELRPGGTLMIGEQNYPVPPSGKISIKVSPGHHAAALKYKLPAGAGAFGITFHVGNGDEYRWQPQFPPSPQAVRRDQLGKLESRTQRLGSAAATSPAAAELRAELLRFQMEHAGSSEAISAARAASRLRWPADTLALPDSERDGFRLSVAPAELVGQLGDGRLKCWNRVSSVAVNHDGTLIAAGSFDGTTHVFQLATGRRLHSLATGAGQAVVTFSPTSDVLAVAVGLQVITLWNARQGTKLSNDTVLRETSGPVAFSPDGTLLATNGRRGSILLWDIPDGRLRRALIGSAGGSLRSLTFSRGGKMLTSNTSQGLVVLWDVASGQQRRRLAQSYAPLFSPGDQYLAYGTSGGDLVLTDTATGDTARTFDEGGEPLGFSTDGQTVISRRHDRVIVWNRLTGQELRTLTEVPALASVSSDGSTLAAGDDTLGELKLWELSTGAVSNISAHRRGVTALAFGPQASLVVTGGADHAVTVWNAAGASPQLPVGGPIVAADLCSDGEQLIALQEESLAFWRLDANRPLRTLAGATDDLADVACSPDRTLIAGYGGWGAFRISLRLWDGLSGSELPLIDDYPGTLRGLCFSANSKRLAIFGDGASVDVWNAARRRSEQTFDDLTARPVAIALSPDGESLAAALADKTLGIWNVGRGTMRALHDDLAEPVRVLAYSPDARYLAAGTTAGELLLWDVATAKLAATLIADSQISTVAFSPDGSRLTAAGEDGAVRLWNIPQKEIPAETADITIKLGPERGLISRIAFTPEGRHLITLNGNGTIYILRLPSNSN